MKNKIYQVGYGNVTGLNRWAIVAYGKTLAEARKNLKIEMRKKMNDGFLVESSLGRYTENEIEGEQ